MVTIRKAAWHNMTLPQGREFALWFFVRIARFLRAKERFTIFKEQITFFIFFCKERQEQFPLLQRTRRAMKSDSLFCFGHKKWKSMVKRTNLKRITLKKSKSIFHKERIAPVTLYLQTTFSPVPLSVNSDKTDLLLSLFLKEWQEQKSKFPTLHYLPPLHQFPLWDG